tara:strand:+ start:348 stop:605 length:258 start_codon:yes stop_codon:yes gene_type:complete
MPYIIILLKTGNYERKIMIDIDEMVEKYFKDGETAQHTLEQMGMFEEMGKQYIFTQDWDTINHWITMRKEFENDFTRISTDLDNK